MSHGMTPGRYVTANGSEVVIRGEHSGSVEIEFDWLEESACIEADFWVQDGELLWECDCCGVFSEQLQRVT